MPSSSSTSGIPTGETDVVTTKNLPLTLCGCGTGEVRFGYVKIPQESEDVQNISLKNTFFCLCQQAGRFECDVKTIENIYRKNGG